MPESVTDRPTRSHEYIFLLTKSARYFYDAEAVREPINPNNNGTIRAPKLQGGRIGIEREMNERHYEEIKGRNLRSVWTFATQPYKEAHFATFPEELVQRCIMAGTAAQACPKCGAAWARILGNPQRVTSGGYGSKTADHVGLSLTPSIRTKTWTENETLGFRLSCKCDGNDGSGRCIVLDPFIGSGTTGKVAESLGRDWIGIDLKLEYNKMAQERVSVKWGCKSNVKHRNNAVQAP
jgi:DNA modification methylase